MKKIFIDGKAGTTGLGIEERLLSRDDVEIISLDESLRKDPDARREMLNRADVVFLCLPDDAAREAVSMITNENVVVIDASTAHRTDPGWAYGLPELGEDYLENIRKSKRIAVPGCHASGFITLVYPLIKAGIIGKDAMLSAHSITGYSGGGKKMIAEYEAEELSTSILIAWKTCFAGCPFFSRTFGGSDFLMISTKSNVVSIGFTSLALTMFLAIWNADFSSP